MRTINIQSIIDTADGIISNTRLLDIVVDNTNIINGDMVTQILLASYGDKCYKVTKAYYPSAVVINYPTEYTTEEKQALSYFLFLWLTFWNADRKASLSRVYSALNLDYDPISNYDRKSEYKEGRRIDGETDTNTKTGTRTNTSTETGNITDNLTKQGSESNSGTDNTTHQVTTYDDTSFRNDSKDDNSNTNTLTFNNRQDMRTTTFNQHKNENVESFTNYKDETKKVNTNFNKTINTTNDLFSEYTHHYDETKGNIGVTTSQQMLQSEIELRKYNLISAYIDEFINTYFFYV